MSAEGEFFQVIVIECCLAKHVRNMSISGLKVPGCRARSTNDPCLALFSESYICTQNNLPFSMYVLKYRKNMGD